MSQLTSGLAHDFASIALSHVTREYPNKLDHVLQGPDDMRGPRALHPVFYGSFDWHSCVHGYWLLAVLYRRFPEMPLAGAIRALFDEHLTAERVAGECKYLDRPASAGFERTYGWAWLLKLAAELRLHSTPEGQGWAAALHPLAERFAYRFRTYLPRAAYPIRSGTHANTAFALRLAFDYADPALRALLSESAIRWYQGDADCQAWEPSGDDFLSSALMEAECMRVMLPEASFASWFATFLPDIGHGRPASLFTPASVVDRTDGKIVHLDGLNLSRAWCWRSLAAWSGHEAMVERTAQAHIDASLPHVGGHYMGSHWLASFAALALGA